MIYDLKKLENFPSQPGVYLMKSKTGVVLYVGKGNNIKQRVKQYFSPGGDGRAKVPFLISKVADIETIVVFSEKEALLLENTLIKQHKPKYNALLKDDKSYIALKLTTKQTWPMLQLVRYKNKPKSDGVYFGPYTSAYGARQTFDLLNRLFPLRQCSDQELARRTRPCILYGMKRCVAPCVNKCTKEEYDHLVDKTIKFLRGQDKDVVKELYDEMNAASDALEFERAADILKMIRQIEKTIEEQNVDRPLGNDIDVIGICREGDEVILCQLLFRRGKLSGSIRHDFSMIAEDDEELLESFLLQHYSSKEELPHEILLPNVLADGAVIAEIISANKRRKTQIVTPRKGEKKELVEMAHLNAKALFKKDKDVRSIREKILLEIQEKFRLNRYPRRIECFDNSNTGGREIVSTLVAFTEGLKDSSRYRKYKIRTIEQQDDYGAMKEALSRRYIRAKEENDLPDLLIVDGGKGHLNMAIKVLEQLNITTIDVIGIAKEEGRHDRGITGEQVFLPNVKDPILLGKTSSVLFLLQQIRDEAHRTAIAYHRKLREKKTLKSELDLVPGIGPAKRNALLKQFGSMKRIKEASEDDLLQTKGISQSNVKALLDYFNRLN